MTNTNLHPLANPFNKHHYDTTRCLFRHVKHDKLKLPDSTINYGQNELHIPYHGSPMRILDYRNYSKTWNNNDIYSLNTNLRGMSINDLVDDQYFINAKKELMKLLANITTEQKYMIAHFEALHPSKWIDDN